VSVADGELERAVDDVEGLVVGVVDVLWRADDTRLRDVLVEGEGAVGALIDLEPHRAVAEEAEDFAAVGCDGKRDVDVAAGRSGLSGKSGCASSSGCRPGCWICATSTAMMPTFLEVAARSH
jgi:hypothetical protein